MITVIKQGNAYNRRVISLEGLSTDTKPVEYFIETDSNGVEVARVYIENGSTFTEIDTGKLFMYDAENTVWYEIETSGGGGGGGTDNYNSLSNKPQINGTVLSGNKTSDNLGLQNKISATNKIDSDFVDDENSANKFMSEAEKIKLVSLVNYDDTEVKEDISDIETALNSHKSDKTNPHEVTKAQVGLGNVDNTSDANKPISTATQAALDLKADATDIPTVNNATITIQKNGTKVDDFTVNASSNKTINITVPTSASDVSALPSSTKYAGAATAGGSATSAAKLDTASAGSTTQPVYFANGVPTSTTYSLGKSVPSNAVFTDTTVGSGIVLTGYTPESPSKTDTIVATDTVNAAIKKLDERSRVDENNILFNTNQGVKNLFNLTKVSGTYNTVVFTVNSDKTVTVNGTASPANSVFNLDDWTCTKAGTYVISGAPSGGSWVPSPNTYRIRVAVNGTWKGDDVGNGFALTLALGDVVNLQINTSTSYTANNLVFKPMITLKSLYDADPSYQSYALSNAELTEEINPTAYTAPRTNTGYNITIESGGYFVCGKICFINVRLTAGTDIPNNTYFLYDLPEALTPLTAGSSICALNNNRGVYISVASQGNVLNASGAAITAGQLLLTGAYLIK